MKVVSKISNSYQLSVNRDLSISQSLLEPGQEEF
ncbi:hypothetical protein Riv7116_2809 [Rivularia sp. PCC 7116]|nr:hypothetical protein Riv7116_2809 [Rivularia sp. PCC 7116]